MPQLIHDHLVNLTAQWLALGRPDWLDGPTRENKRIVLNQEALCLRHQVSQRAAGVKTNGALQRSAGQQPIRAATVLKRLCYFGLVVTVFVSDRSNFVIR